MNQQEILKKIGGIIAELKEQYAYLEAANSEFNELKLELFLANANFLTDHIEILKKIYGQAKFTALPTAAPVSFAEKKYVQNLQIPDHFKEEGHSPFAEETIPEKTESTLVIEETVEQVFETPAAAIMQKETIILPEAMPQEQINGSLAVEDASFTIEKYALPEKPMAAKEGIFLEPEVKPAAIQVQPEIIPPVEIQPEPNVFIAETEPEPVKQEFKKTEDEPVLTLNQKIAVQKGLGLTGAAPETLKHPVQDLQSVISLNDKLLFVKELFNGYNLAYTEAVNILNRYTSFEQAEHFLNLNYTVKNNWREKPATAERFYDLLRKRFS